MHIAIQKELAVPPRHLHTKIEEKSITGQR
jgi:hypothetical protein